MVWYTVACIAGNFITIGNISLWISIFDAGLVHSNVKYVYAQAANKGSKF